MNSRYLDSYGINITKLIDSCHRPFLLWLLMAVTSMVLRRLKGWSRFPGKRGLLTECFESPNLCAEVQSSSSQHLDVGLWGVCVYITRVEPFWWDEWLARSWTLCQWRRSCVQASKWLSQTPDLQLPHPGSHRLWSSVPSRDCSAHHLRYFC